MGIASLHDMITQRGAVCGEDTTICWEELTTNLATENRGGIIAEVE